MFDRDPISLAMQKDYNAFFKFMLLFARFHMYKFIYARLQVIDDLK